MPMIPAIRSAFHAMLPAVIVPIAAGALAGCGSMYRPALYDTNLPAPVALHGDASGTYYALEGGASRGFNEGDRIRIARAHYMTAEHRGAARISYGAYFYGGSYRLREELNRNLHDPRTFGGAGAQADLAFIESRGNISLGGGIHTSLGVELGPYPLLWHRRGMIPYVALAELYATFGIRLDDDRWLAFQAGAGLPGLVSLNAQLDLDNILIWGGGGTSLEQFPTPGMIGRFAAGVSYRAE